MQMIDVWYISFLGASAIGVVPFDFCLKALPRFIREVAHPLASSTPSTVCCDAPRAPPETSDPMPSFSPARAGPEGQAGFRTRAYARCGGGVIERRCSSAHQHSAPPDSALPCPRATVRAQLACVRPAARVLWARQERHS